MEAIMIVLLVHSYDPGYDWTNSITKGIQDELRGQPVRLGVIYMDTKRRTDPAWARKAGDLAARKVDELHPEVVIACDDNAQEYFAKRYVGRASPQVVFCGVNADPARYGYPAANVTGVRERVWFTETLDLLKAISPEVRTVAYLTDDSTTSKLMVDFCRQQKPSVNVVSWDEASTFADWQARVEGYGEDVDAICVGTYHTVKKASPEEAGAHDRVSPGEVAAWTVAHTKRPVVGLFDFAVEDGMLCGVVESGEDDGRAAGKLVLEILEGKKAGALPIQIGAAKRTLINAATARQLGIEIPQTVLDAADQVFGR
jgi:ABC-type uncharacterized transport system substrate-binding protein